MRRGLQLAVVFLLTLVFAGCASDPSPIMPYVVGERLDLAQSDIKRAGFTGTVGIVGGGALGVLVASDWLVCAQLPAAGEIVQTAPRLTVVYFDQSCDGYSPGPVMPDLVGRRLDRAKSDIKRAGFDGEVEILGGGVLGVLRESNWVVCEQLPDAGEAMRDAPRLTIDRSCEEGSS